MCNIHKMSDTIVSGSIDISSDKNVVAIIMAGGL
jgi:hypothetical protein